MVSCNYFFFEAKCQTKFAERLLGQMFSLLSRNHTLFFATRKFWIVLFSTISSTISCYFLREITIFELRYKQIFYYQLTISTCKISFDNSQAKKKNNFPAIYFSSFLTERSINY